MSESNAAAWAQKVIEEHGYVADRVHNEMVGLGIRDKVYISGRRDNTYIPQTGDLVEDASTQLTVTTTDGYPENRRGPSHGVFQWCGIEPGYISYGAFHSLALCGAVCPRGALGDRTSPTPESVPLYGKRPNGDVVEFPVGDSRHALADSFCREWQPQTYVALFYDRACSQVATTWETY